MENIKAISAAQLKFLKKLDQKKYRGESERFIVEGPHLVAELLSSDWEADFILARKDVYEEGRLTAISASAMKRGIELHLAAKREFDAVADTVTSQGVLALVRMNKRGSSVKWGGGEKKLTIVALNNIADPGNLGTIMRTCAWFGVDYLLMDEGSVDVFNPKVVRATMGAIFHLPVIIGADLQKSIAEAKRQGVTVYSTTLDGGRPLDSTTFGNRAILLFGNEARGVDEKLRAASDVSLMIPRIGSGESLNVAVACGIVLQSATAAFPVKKV
jgi:TrmH family RNA methyltransferase